MTALAVSEDETSAWFAGVGKDGRNFVAYVEDNGEPNVEDIFRLWIDGILHGAAVVYLAIRAQDALNPVTSSDFHIG